MRAPGLLGGGYVERALAAAGGEPYASLALVHVTDLPVTLVRLAGGGGDDDDNDEVRCSLSNDAARDGGGRSHQRMPRRRRGMR